MSHSLQPSRQAALGLLSAALFTTAAAGQTAGDGPPGSVAAPPPTTAPAKILAPGPKVLEDALTALGGRAAIGEVETVEYRLEAAIAGGPATLTLRNGRGGRFIVHGEGTTGEIFMGRVGRVAWRRASDGTYVLLAPTRVGPDILGYIFTLADPSTRAKTVDHLSFEDVDCWKVEITDPDGDVTFAYFSTESGLLHGIDKHRTVRDEPRITRTTFSAYKPAPPLTLFHEARMVQLKRAALAEFKFSDFTFNRVPESEFAIPAEVTALVEAEHAPPTSQPAVVEQAPKANPQMQRLLERLKEMDDVAQLEMLAGFLEGRLGKEESDADRAQMELVVEKIRARIEEIKAGEPTVDPPDKTGGGAAGGG